MLVGQGFSIDVVALLRELDVSVSQGSSDSSWLLRTPDGRHHDVTFQQPVPHLTAHLLRSTRGTSQALHVGSTAAPGVTSQAQAGGIDTLTQEPLRLILKGRVYGSDELPEPPNPATRRRPPWVRLAVMRYLLITDQPARHQEIADAIGATQQSVSQAAKRLGSFVRNDGAGLVAADRPGLLRRWMADYPGPGGQRFGWYSLDPPQHQATKALDLADTLGENALLSGDAAADLLAPWKVPSHSVLYTRTPMDLANEGFVPAPVDQATFVVCSPQDPMIWKLAAMSKHSPQVSQPVADPTLVYWDVAHGTDPDSREAAGQIAKLVLGGDVE